MFTSQTAVEAASAAMLGPEVNQAQLAQKWEGRPVFVVGKATSQAGKDMSVQSSCKNILQANAYFSTSGKLVRPGGLRVVQRKC